MADQTVYREQAQAMSEAHAQGLHSEQPRQFCPDCDGRDLSSYPRQTCTSCGGLLKAGAEPWCLTKDRHGTPVG